MNFVSIPFLFLLITTLALIAVVKAPSGRKIILLVACCVFYAYWDWRFFLLLAAFILINYHLTRQVVTSPNPKTQKAWLISGILICLVYLGFFKYFNFFIDSFNFQFASFGWRLDTLRIILPLGISFYTFEALSYLIDIRRGTTGPAKSLLDYALFMTFFPRIVSGPIVRAAQFFPQLERGIQLNHPNMVEGVQLVLRGMIKKLVIADHLAGMTDLIYTSPAIFSSFTVWTGVLAYSIQILLDFSGYTDMAIGIAKILGFDLPQNFNLPYTSQSISEFWRRWHMTLSAWFRDYVFYPLEVTRARRSRPPVFQYLNIIIVFLLTGLWHGASWNFVLWGGLYGIYLAFERLFYKGKIPNGQWTSPLTWIKALITFLIVSVTWVFFRSPTFENTGLILQKLVFLKPAGLDWLYSPALWAILAVVIGGFLIRRVDYRFTTLTMQKSYTLAVILLQIMFIFFFWATNTSPFIYFQF